MTRAALVTLVALACSAGAAQAQRLDTAARFDPGLEPAGFAGDGHARFRPLGVAKWSSAGLTLGSAFYGFRSQRRADRQYQALERACRDDAERCAVRLPDGAFADPELEAMYQDVASLDERARTALIVTQVGVAASVALFVLDIRSGRGPRNIPYDPDRFRLTPMPDGRIELRIVHPLK